MQKTRSHFFNFAFIFFTATFTLQAWSTDLLPKPRIDVPFEDSRVKMVAGLRPYRKGGIRMEREETRRLVIWHNYGHGGAGITLSWGTADHVVDSAKSDLVNPPKVVVLGAGAVGLSTAYLLAQKGISVELISDNFHPDVTSAVAGGLWMPSSVDLSHPEPKIIYGILRRSFLLFQEMSQAGFAVRPMRYFSTSPLGKSAPFSLADLARRKIIPPFKTHERLPIEGLHTAGVEYETILMDMPLYIPQLQAAVERLGVRLQQRKFSTLREIEAALPPGTVVFNCTGLGSRTLFGDENLIPIKGQLVLIEREETDPPTANDYMISTDAGYLFMRAGEYLLGGTFEEGVWDKTPDETVGRRILRDHQATFGLD